MKYRFVPKRECHNAVLNEIGQNQLLSMLYLKKKKKSVLKNNIQQTTKVHYSICTKIFKKKIKFNKITKINLNHLKKIQKNTSHAN